MQPKCVIFIPVSSPSGSGEYERSLIIAKFILQQWPQTKIHFILNKNARYINDCPFDSHLCQDSPTKDTARVNSIIQELQPDLVIFDGSGRAKQFKKAKEVGAKVVFLSQRAKKRRRGLKLNRLFHIDLHWVVQPDFCIKKLSLFQRSKLKFFNKPHPNNIGSVFIPPSISNQHYILTQLNLVSEDYFIFTSGSGGTFVGDELAADIYYQAACKFYQKTKIKCLVVFGSSYPKAIDSKCDGVVCLKSINNEYFIPLIQSALGCVVAAGDTLLQCIALKKVCIASALSTDQKDRLRLCVAKNLVLAAEVTSDSICEQALLLVDNNEERLNLIKSMEKETYINALNIISLDLQSLVFND